MLLINKKRILQLSLISVASEKQLWDGSYWLNGLVLGFELDFDEIRHFKRRIIINFELFSILCS